ncbi:MAG: hypothetical protein ACK5OX_14930 [Desertimonas sp.]
MRTDMVVDALDTENDDIEAVGDVCATVQHPTLSRCQRSWWNNV